ncbi:hypothetical protein TRFO_32346 [Tritrichomonas foetus]|uniref:USP domain-containing protein n=1 Tax=Tritrichomonas foetus TaxID=1144522 RepID=A0A1J4JQ46_9EUKA|nr:hypothetical protein TRFO_32346 [Tritrichomonas foetus]|eukprot:OHT00874.1 hypothetical protein TRFO_32346 [Tritrichomonas foetus]
MPFFRQNFLRLKFKLFFFMNGVLQAFSEWCDNFPDKIDVMKPDFLSNLLYFEQVLDYYRNAFILCDPYQQLTEKFATFTIPNTFVNLLKLPKLSQDIYQKVIFILGKIIDLIGKLIVKNIIFYKDFIKICGLITFDNNQKFMKENPQAKNDIIKLIYQNPYQELSIWASQLPALDWYSFDFILSYIFYCFSDNLEFLMSGIDVFKVLFNSLIVKTIENPKLIDQTYIPDSLPILCVIYSLKFGDFLSFSNLVKLLIKLFITNKYNSIGLFAIRNLNRFDFNSFSQEKKEFYCQSLSCINIFDYIFDEGILQQTKSEISSLPIKMTYSQLINYCQKIKNLKSINEYVNSIPSIISCFKFFNNQEQSKVFKSLLNSENLDNLYSSYILVKLLEISKAEKGDPLYDDCFYFLMKSPENSVAIFGLTFSKTLSLIVLDFIIRNSEKSQINLFIQKFVYSNRENLKNIDETIVHPMLVKGDVISFINYMTFVIYCSFTINSEVIQDIWNFCQTDSKLLENIAKALIVRGMKLFSEDGKMKLYNLFKNFDFENASDDLIILIVYFSIVDGLQKHTVVYKNLQEKRLIAIPTLFEFVQFDQLGIPELIKCFLYTKTSFQCAKSQMFYIWRKCNIASYFDRNESLSDYLLKYSSTIEHFIRCFDFLYLFVSETDFKLIYDVIVSPFKKFSHKGLIKFVFIEKRTQRTEFIYFSPSELMTVVYLKVAYKFNCNKDSLVIEHHGKQLSKKYTIETNNLYDGMAFNIEGKQKMIEEPFYNIIYETGILFTPIYSKALELIQSINSNSQTTPDSQSNDKSNDNKVENEEDSKLDDKNKELAQTILRFINYLPMQQELASLVENHEAFQKCIIESTNEYIREVYLRALLNILENDKDAHQKYQESNFYNVLIQILKEKILNKQGKKLLLSALISIFPDNFSSDLPSFINQVIQILIDTSSSKKLVNLTIKLLLKIFEKNKDELSSLIKENILDIVLNIKYNVIGKILYILPNKSEIYDILTKFLPEFMKSPKYDEQASIFFDAIIDSFDSSKNDLTTLTEFALVNMNSPNKMLVQSVFQYISTQPSLISKIDTDFLFYTIENESTYTYMYNLIKIVFQNVPEKFNKIFTRLQNYVSMNLTEYNIIPCKNYDQSSNLSIFPRVGLKNLGATCYINSTFQLLFSISQFTDEFLLYESFNSEWQQNAQKVFAFMKFNHFYFTDPTSFVKSYKFFGAPINIGEQQDMVEFFLSFINDLPEELTSMFSGDLVNSFIGIDSPFNSETKERFFTLALSVDGHDSLSSSLKAFLQDEVVDDYYDSTNKCQISVKHSAIIKRLPDVLLLQLRRFFYNTATKKREKISTPFSFPFTLDMSEFSDDKENATYFLKGFILHIGTADSGHFHYISNEEGVWYDHNDSHVSTYDISRLSSDAFGSFLDSSISQTAYVLVYSRVNYKSTLQKDEISQDLRNELMIETLENNKINFVTSNEFFEIACLSSDILFLFNYFYHILLHLYDDECDKRMKVICDKLIQIINDDSKQTKNIIAIIEKDITGTIYPIALGKSQSMKRIWINFLKTIFVKSELDDLNVIISYIMRSFQLFKDFPDQEVFFVELVYEFLKLPGSLVIAHHYMWPTLIVLSLTQKITEKVDFDMFYYLETLTLCSSLLDLQISELILNIHQFILKKHLDSYEKLVRSLPLLK